MPSDQMTDREPGGVRGEGGSMIPATAMAILIRTCESRGMVLPALNVVHPITLQRVTRRQHNDIYTTPTNQPNRRQLCAMLAVVMGMGAEAAWVRRESLGWYLCVPFTPPGDAWDDRSEECQPLHGIPSGVTDPAEALAWALCWWASVQRLRESDRARATSWGALPAIACTGLPPLLPSRNGVTMEIPCSSH